MFITGSGALRFKHEEGETEGKTCSTRELCPPTLLGSLYPYTSIGVIGSSTQQMVDTQWSLMSRLPLVGRASDCRDFHFLSTYFLFYVMYIYYIYI